MCFTCVSHVICHMSHVMCHVSHVTCHMTALHPNCQTQEPEIFDNVHHPLCVTCHVSHVTCYMSSVTCHVSLITCILSSSFGPIGVAGWWRVFYQRGLTCLVYKLTQSLSSYSLKRYNIKNIARKLNLFTECSFDICRL